MNEVSGEGRELFVGELRKSISNIFLIDAEGLERLSRNAKSDPSTGRKTLKSKTVCEGAFRKPLYKPGRNDHLRRILDEIQDQVAMISVSTWRRHASWVEEESEHAAILDAVKRKDPETARDLMTKHIGGFFSRLDS